ncbi:MAG: glycosyltransferase, partial [Janthinobacterium sp.]
PERRILARKQLGLPPDALVLGCVARLSAQKRPQALLALFARLAVQFPHLYLVLVGTGPLEAMLRLQAQQSGLQDRVVFAGFQQRIELLMPAFDLHLLLSRNEGFGIATIEALACGVPAVGPDVPGTRDILGDCAGGLLLPLDDEQAACELVAGLLRDPARRQRMGRQARQEALQHYSMQRLEQQLRQFYAGLV